MVVGEGKGMRTVEYLNRFTCICQPVFVGQSLYPQRQREEEEPRTAQIKSPVFLFLLPPLLRTNTTRRKKRVFLQHHHHQLPNVLFLLSPFNKQQPPPPSVATYLTTITTTWLNKTVFLFFFFFLPWNWLWVWETRPSLLPFSTRPRWIYPPTRTHLGCSAWRRVSPPPPPPPIKEAMLLRGGVFLQIHRFSSTFFLSLRFSDPNNNLPLNFGSLGSPKHVNNLSPFLPFLTPSKSAKWYTNLNLTLFHINNKISLLVEA